MSSSDHTAASSPAVPVAAGHVRLVLLHDDNSYFFLEIPIERIVSVCSRPLKYLLFLGWCVLGTEGVLYRNGEEIRTNGDLDEQGTYHYTTNDVFDIDRAVDPEVIKERSTVPSEGTASCQNFRGLVLERDGYCVFSGAVAEECRRVHIIPHPLGSEWLQHIIQNRPHYDENTEEFTDIDDVRNSVLGWVAIHCRFNLREVAILKTPNFVLDLADVPQRAVRKLDADAAYPDHECFTLQNLLPPVFSSPVIPTTWMQPS